MSAGTIEDVQTLDGKEPLPDWSNVKSFVRRVEARRAGGGVICQACGKEYRQHPNSGHRDWNGDPFLKRLCNGDLVKL